MTETREQMAERIIGQDDGLAIRPRVNCGAIFAGRYPGGFAPVSKASEGRSFEYCPSSVAYVGRDLTDAEFERLCEAIRTYQRATAINFALQLSPETIVMAFVADEPEHAAVLIAAAERLRIPLGRFLGADRGTGVFT